MAHGSWRLRSGWQTSRKHGRETDKQKWQRIKCAISIEGHQRVVQTSSSQREVGGFWGVGVATSNGWRWLAGGNSAADVPQTI